MAKNEQFFWGASTAAHQVEGGTYNQWSAWELAHAKAQAKTAKERLGWLPSWERVQLAAKNPDNYVSGKGVDHYNRYTEDFDLLKKLQLNAFRFTIEWSRLEPEEGKWDPAAFQHYKDYIAELKKRDIEPFLNIWHWTVPVWFAEKGGFAKQANLRYFDELVKKVRDELLTDVQYVITLNEPNVYMGMSYGQGEWPPQESNQLKAIWVYWNLARAHKRAWRIIKHKKPTIQIGVAQQLANIQPSRPGHWLDESIVKIMRYAWNWWWLNRIRRHQDFVGFNYYFTDYYEGFRRKNPAKPANDLGWYMEPTGMLALLQRIAVHYPGKPIIITENGLADAQDTHRKWWLEQTMQVIETAQSQNIPIRGYLHWSLLDNFEWAFGWWPEFGLVHVDRVHGMKRTIRKSAIWWANELKKRGTHE